MGVGMHMLVVMGVEVGIVIMAEREVGMGTTAIPAEAASPPG